MRTLHALAHVLSPTPSKRSERRERRGASIFLSLYVSLGARLPQRPRPRAQSRRSQPFARDARTRHGGDGSGAPQQKPSSDALLRDRLLLRELSTRTPNEQRSRTTSRDGEPRSLRYVREDRRLPCPCCGLWLAAHADKHTCRKARTHTHKIKACAERFPRACA